MFPKSTFSLSDLLRRCAAGIAAASLLAFSAPLQAETPRAVMHSAQRALDPVATTVSMRRDRGYMIFHALFVPRANLMSLPQIADIWETPDDGLISSSPMRPVLVSGPEHREFARIVNLRCPPFCKSTVYYTRMAKWSGTRKSKRAYA